MFSQEFSIVDSIKIHNVVFSADSGFWCVDVLVSRIGVRREVAALRRLIMSLTSLHSHIYIELTNTTSII